MANEISSPVAAKIVIFNPDDLTRVFQFTGSGSPGFVNYSTAVASECMAATTQYLSTNQHLLALPGSLSASRTYPIRRYAAAATAFTDAFSSGVHGPGNDAVVPSDDAIVEIKYGLATADELEEVNERTVAIVEDTMLILSVLAGFNDVSAAEVANAILETPDNKIETDSEGRVRTSNPGGGSSGPTVEQIWTYAQRTLTEGVAVAYPAQQVGNRRAVSGDDYGPTTRRFLIAKEAGADWPDDLSLYTWTFKCNKASGNANAAASSAVTCTAAVTVATGDGRSFDITINAADSASAEGQYRYTLRGTRISDSKKYSAEIGILTFVKDEN